MKITCNQFEASTRVNQIGKYLYKNIDGAYKFKKSANTYDIWMTVYYQIPILPDKPSDKITYSDLHEMDMNISLTTYQNKIRVNIIELSPEELTLLHFTVPEKKLANLQEVRKLVLDKIETALNRYYAGYEFIF